MLSVCVCVCVCLQLRRVLFFVTPWTATRQVPLSIRYSRQEFWSGLPFPSPGDLPEPGIELVSLASPALAGWFFTLAPPNHYNWYPNNRETFGDRDTHTWKVNAMCRQKQSSV